MSDAPKRTVGIIGGSGVTGVLGDRARTDHRVGTPWGAPSGPIEVMTVTPVAKCPIASRS